jgi:hypothetical protein
VFFQHSLRSLKTPDVGFLKELILFFGSGNGNGITGNGNGKGVHLLDFLQLEKPVSPVFGVNEETVARLINPFSFGQTVSVARSPQWARCSVRQDLK